MSNSQNPESQNIIQRQSEQLIPQQSFIPLDEFKSLFYQLNAKPDTEIRLLPGKKKLELADIRSINEQISDKLHNHDLVSSIASINFVLSNKKIKDYFTWAEFERENWDTVNEKIRTINIKWDVAIKLPQYRMPQRHSLKITIGTEIAPKDIFQMILASDDIVEFMEATTPGICKVDFVNDILASELINIVVNWHEGLRDLPETNPLSSFLIKHGKQLSKIIRYYSPIFFLIISCQYNEFWMPLIGIQEQISLKSLEALLTILSAVFITGILLGYEIERFIDKRIDKLEEHPRFSITRGDKKAAEEFEKTNKNLTNQIMSRLFWIVFGFIVTSLIKFIIPYVLVYLKLG
ncbi:MAG: hypothetical protein ACK4V0_05425 [Aphanizomenon sp.]|jgi:hypothetical protein